MVMMCKVKKHGLVTTVWWLAASALKPLDHGNTADYCLVVYAVNTHNIMTVCSLSHKLMKAILTLVVLWIITQHVSTFIQLN